MHRTDRLFAIAQTLQDGELHQAQEFAERFDVSLRTIYRDVERLMTSGLPVKGTRGSGYHLARVTTLPPLSLSDDELEALQLGLAIVAETTDPELKAAAERLTQKMDENLDFQALPQSVDWQSDVSRFADAVRGFSQMPRLRAAIRARQKLKLVMLSTDGAQDEQIVRPLKLQHWGRIWALTVWSETAHRHLRLRVDLIAQADPLPELFVDEPGKTLEDIDLSTPPDRSVF